MVTRLAFGRRAIVTALTTPGNCAVVKAHIGPARRRVAAIALIARSNMVARLALGRRAIVTALTTPGNCAVIEAHIGPAR